MKMVIAFMKLCLCLYLYHCVQVLVSANTTSSHILEIDTTTLIKLDENDTNLIDTPGCTIPNILTNYRIVETKDCKNRCGTRAVFIKKLNDDNIIEYTINENLMKTFYGENSYECCSRFASMSVSDNNLKFTQCTPFRNGTQMVLKYEIITVTCKSNANSTNYYVYDDAYILIQKLVTESRKNSGDSWNVLLMGMDTMSRGRAIQSMPKLVKYFKENGWLDYRAFQKAQDNTYPNLMITYTGIYEPNLLPEECNNVTLDCNELFIWSKFKSSGFVTAYGEDDLTHTFERIVTSQPTDHYTRSFFLLGAESQGNIVCLRTRPSTYHILDYVYQFAKVYKGDKYFGSFWTRHYSHDPVQIPTLLQNQYIKLFKKLNRLGALNNTIIFFYGDHGVRHGPLKLPVASYYDDRLPMLYMWFPHSFRKLYEENYYNLQLNQRRLTTHSDLHSTLWDILKLSDDNVTIIPPKYCPSCGTLLEEKPKHRRCEDINVTARWCSCYVLNYVSSTDIAATLVPEILLYQISKEQNTEFEIKKILRHQRFSNEYDRNDNTTYYVLAIQVTKADKQFEGVVKQNNFNFVVLDKIDDISPLAHDVDNSLC